MWCPDLRGPCVKLEETSFATVYCAGKMHCDNLLLPNNVSGVCEEQGPGYRVPEVSASGQFTNNFLECTYDETNNLWIWQKGTCEGDELFNGKDCMKSCSKFDSRGVKWDVPYLEIGVKSCDENEGGNIGSKQIIWRVTVSEVINRDEYFISSSVNQSTRSSYSLSHLFMQLSHR